MKKALLIVCTLLLVAGSVAVMMADSASKAALCVTLTGTTGLPNDVCATCTSNSVQQFVNSNGTDSNGDVASCVCKLSAAEDPVGFAANFNSQGACVKYAHSIGL